MNPEIDEWLQQHQSILSDAEFLETQQNDLLNIITGVLRGGGVMSSSFQKAVAKDQRSERLCRSTGASGTGPRLADTSHKYTDIMFVCV